MARIKRTRGQDEHWRGAGSPFQTKTNSKMYAKHDKTQETLGGVTSFEGLTARRDQPLALTPAQLLHLTDRVAQKHPWAGSADMDGFNRFLRHATLVNRPAVPLPN